MRTLLLCVVAVAGVVACADTPPAASAPVGTARGAALPEVGLQLYSLRHHLTEDFDGGMDSIQAWGMTVVAAVSALLLLLLLACSDAGEGAGGTPEVAVADTTARSASPSAATLAAADTLYAWVDGLSLRAAPEPSATRVGRAGPGDALVPTGRVDGETTAVVLRGGLYEAPWVEVSPPDGRTAWAFGGGLRRPADPAGPAPARHDLIDVEHFGRFDLTRWRETAREPLNETEVDGTVTRYRAAARELEVTVVEMGELHYGTTHRLIGDDGTLLREHRFSWDAGAGGHVLNEEVVVREGMRPRRYARTQAAATHYRDLPERPSRVVGPWREERLAAPGASMPDAPKPIVIVELLDGAYRSLDDPRAGIVVLDGRLSHSYDGQADELHPYRIAGACPGHEAAPVEVGPMQRLVVDEPLGTTCYYISEAAANYIELFVPGNGLLRYERVGEDGI